MLETFTRSTFEPLLGDTFRVHLGGPGAIEVVLTDASELSMASARPDRTPFSIVFRGPAGGILPQGTYRMDHQGLGAFDLFLVPIGADGEAVRYEAVFT